MRPRNRIDHLLGALGWRLDRRRSGDVLIIGDSHVLLSGGGESFPGCDVHAARGRRSTEGLSVLREVLRARHEVIVFDLASNDVLDPPALSTNLESVMGLIGDRPLVLVNAWRDDFRDLHLAVNGILRRFSERHRDRVVFVDWAAYIENHPAPLSAGSDRIHFAAAVYRDRVALLSEAIEKARALASGGGSTG